jgi:hypothetical protein
MASLKIRLKLSSNQLDRTLLYVLIADDNSTIYDNISNITNYINNNSNKSLHNDNIKKIFLVENNEKIEIPLDNKVAEYLNQNDHIFCEFDDITDDKSSREDLQDFKRSKNEEKTIRNENEMDVVVVDQPKRTKKFLELYYQTLPDARLGKLPKKLSVNDSMTLLDLKKILAKEMNETITTTIGNDEMDVDTIIDKCRLRLEIPKGIMEIEISEDAKLCALKSLISDMTEGDIDENNIYNFILNGVKLDSGDIIKNIALQQAQSGNPIQIFGGKNCFSCENFERFEILVSGEGVLNQFLLDASVEIDNSSLKHIVGHLQSQTVGDLKLLIGDKYLKKFVDSNFDWPENLVLSFEHKKHVNILKHIRMSE